LAQLAIIYHHYFLQKSACSPYWHQPIHGKRTDFQSWVTVWIYQCKIDSDG